MLQTIQKFVYNEQEVEFEVLNKSIMVNATEMAKIFDKRIDFFLKSDQTKAFLKALKFPPYGGNLGIKNDNDLIQTKGRNGTWMHRILALKFAAWLDPQFEVWVYCTIEDLLFGAYKEVDKSLKESAERLNKIEHLKNALEKTPEFMELEVLKLAEKQAAYSRSKINKTQLELYQTTS